MTGPEVIYLLDQIRDGVREMDGSIEDSIDQIPALRQIARASLEALSQLETRKDRFVSHLIEMVGNGSLDASQAQYEYDNSQQVEEKS